MKLGIFGINFGIFGRDPHLAVDVACAAERSGWESIWTGEHFALPDPPSPDSPLPPRTPLLDPWIALANIAAVTDTIVLGTGVAVVPLYEPVALAKQVVSLDRVSNGRFRFGIGVGYLARAFAAFGVPLSERGKRTDAALDVLNALWSDEIVNCRYLDRSISGLRAEPRPIQPGGPPIVVGGFTASAFRRAATRGHGWYGFALDPRAAQSALSSLHEVLGRVNRPAGLGPLEISVTPPHDIPLTRDLLSSYRAIGVHRLILQLPRDARSDPQNLLELVESLPTELGTAA